MRNAVAVGLVSCSILLAVACGDSGGGAPADGGASSSSTSSTSSSSSGGEGGAPEPPPAGPNAGKPDPAFGANGVAKQPPNAFNFTVSTGLVTKDDRVIVVGRGIDSVGHYDVVIGKFTKDGALDNPDGSNASIKLGRPGSPDDLTPLTVAEMPAGRLVFTGHAQVASNPTTGFVQMMDLATPATCGGFREAASCFALPNSTVDEKPIAIGAIAIDGAQNVYTAGTGPVGAPTAYDFVITKLKKDGSYFPDPAWGDTALALGQRKVDFGKGDGALLLTIGADGALLATGFSVDGAASKLVLAKLTAAGALDATFGSAGKATPDVLAERAITLADGKILAVGHDLAGAKTTFARVLPDGTIDPAFGKVAAAYTADANATIAAVQALADGRVLVGYSNGTVGRFTAAGALDTTWNGTGFAVASWPAGVTLTALGVQSSGLVVALGGRAKSGNPSDPELENAMFAVRFQN